LTAARLAQLLGLYRSGRDRRRADRDRWGPAPPDQDPRPHRDRRPGPAKGGRYLDDRPPCGYQLRDGARTPTHQGRRWQAPARIGDRRVGNEGNEKATGWRYSITCTNIPAAGIPGVPGSHHPQVIDVVHREHADGEGGVRAGKAMGLRNLPSKTWTVNCGWVLAANIAADLAARTRLLGLHDQKGMEDAEPDMLRYRIWHIPARLVRHARQRVLKISPGWPWKVAFLTCWQRLSTLPAPA